MNLYKDISSYADKEKGHLNVVIDIPRGQSNKYEYDEKEGYFKLDRVLYSQMFYPFDYGFVPQSHYEDGDAVDVCVLTTYPTFSGCVIKVRVIGAMDTSDESGHDLKVIAVPTEKIDPRFAEIQTIEDLPAHIREELLLHFKEIKKLEKAKYDHVRINGFIDKDETYAEIDRAIATFKEYNQ
ncbi:MAG: inorganic diphosphatase [bacterium]|nr:inorganic diphosphatase [bacterium]